MRPVAPLYGIEAATGGRLVVFGGGTPPTDEDDRVVGGVGVSGEQDQDVAAAGAAAF